MQSSPIAIRQQSYNYTSGEYISCEEEMILNPTQNLAGDSIGRLQASINKLVKSREGAFPHPFEHLQALRASKRDLKKNEKMFPNEAVVLPLYNALKEKRNELLKIREVAKTVLVEKYVAGFKGRKTRNEVVTAKQMFAMLNEYIGINPHDLFVVSKAICRQINEIMDDPTRYMGKCLQLKPGEKKYPFYNFESKKTDMVSLNFRCWYELSEDKKEIDLFLVPSINNNSESGSYKEVHKAISIKFPLAVQSSFNKNKGQNVYERPWKALPMVLIEPKGVGEAIILEKGILIQEKLKKLAPKAEVVSLPIKFKPLADGTSPSSAQIQCKQKWYNCNLWQAHLNSKIPIGINVGDTLSVSMLDLLKSILEVGKTILHWHDAGFVHRDLKPTNMLIEIKEDKKTFKCRPADFDFVQKIGPGSSYKYSYWDNASCQGLVTPFVDVYGLAMSVGSIFLPGFDYDTPKCIFSEKYRVFFMASVIQKNSLFKFDHLIKKDMTSKVKHETISKWLKKTEDHIDKFIKKSMGLKKEKFQELQNKIIATEQIISLVGDIVRINVVLSTYWIEKYPLWQLINSKNCHTSKDTIKSLLEEVNAIWTTDPEFKQIVFPQVEFQARERIQNIKSYLNSENMPQKALLKEIEVREKAISYASIMENLSPNEQERHGLYFLLQNPMYIDVNKFDEYLNEEIDTFEYSPGLQSRIYEAKELFAEEFEKNKRKVIKNVLNNILSDFDEDEGIRKDAVKVLDQIRMIKYTLAYAIAIKNNFEGNVKNIMENAMNLETFLIRLKAIIDGLTGFEDINEEKKQ